MPLLGFLGFAGFRKEEDDHEESVCVFLKVCLVCVFYLWGCFVEVMSGLIFLFHFIPAFIYLYLFTWIIYIF